MTHPYFADTRHPRVLAHRGLVTAEGEDSGVLENSALAVASAHAHGASYVETDVRVTADGEAVLFHDETLSRLFGRPEVVSDVKTAELERLFAPRGGLLTLRSALESFPTVRFNVDVKTPAAIRAVAAVVAPHTHRVLLTSFTDAVRRRAVAATLSAGAGLRPATSAGRGTIARLRAVSPLRIHALCGPLLRDIDALQVPERLGPVTVLTRPLLAAAHAWGTEVHVWTVNDVDRMRRLIGAGVDGIVTDRADQALQMLGRP